MNTIITSAVSFIWAIAFPVTTTPTDLATSDQAAQAQTIEAEPTIIYLNKQPSEDKIIVIVREPAEPKDETYQTTPAPAESDYLYEKSYEYIDTYPYERYYYYPYPAGSYYYYNYVPRYVRRYDGHQGYQRIHLRRGHRGKGHTILRFSRYLGAYKAGHVSRGYSSKSGHLFSNRSHKSRQFFGQRSHKSRSSFGLRSQHRGGSRMYYRGHSSRGRAHHGGRGGRSFGHRR